LKAVKIKIFGADRLGLSSYIQLRRCAWQMRVTSVGICAYDTRLSDFQEYLPRCLWIAGEARGLVPKASSEDDKRELIKSALLPAYLTKLAKIGWDIQEKSYDEPVSKLESLEPGIKRDIENQKKINAATRSNTISNGKGSGSGNKNNQQSSFQKCPVCKKTHKGKCWFGPGGEKNNNMNI
jgi:hypothetical protein